MADGMSATRAATEVKVFMVVVGAKKYYGKGK